MSNWWKRFFGFDEDEELEDDHYYYPKNNDSLSTTKGRFEDPGRRIEVKMVTQYPSNRKRLEDRQVKPHNSTHEPVRRERKETWDEPAYTRSSRYHNPSLDRAHESNKEFYNNDFFKEQWDRQISERSNERKKPPFRPTMVASPIYGYRQRQTDRHDQQHIKEKSRIDRRDPNDLIETKQMDRHDELSNDFMYDEEPRPVKENENITEQSYESMNSGDDLVDRTENEGIEAYRPQVQNQDEAEPRTETPRASAIPYNVLMYGADRQALRKRQQQIQQINNAYEPKKGIGISTPTQNQSNIELADETSRNEQSLKSHELTLDLLQDPPLDLNNDEEWIAEKQEILKQVLKNFHVQADMVSYVQGPAVTRFEIRLHPGVKVSKVIGLTEDIKLSMAAEQIRIAPVAGKSTVGIEIPNKKRKPVYLKSLLESEAFQSSASPLTAALGLDISGREVVTDLAKMPHGLIAGATGSGKSVCIHSLILSLIYKSDPESLRLVLIDPKVVELSMYQRLPHLAAPVINQPKDAALALRWAVDEMERRYQAFADIGVRDIKKYNQTVGHKEKWPYIVIIIDELADLMMVSPQDVEESICRIAQKARAAGIHMILATQRPSVDVITGLIKANIPTRIAFGVSSQADSRTVLDSGGAERLLGQGDMLFAENGSRDIQRLQGAFVSDEDIDRVTEFLLSWPAPPHLFDPLELREQRQLADDEEDELYHDAAQFVISQGHASVSSLQRHFRIGYNRAARLIDCLEANEIISEANGSKPRQILVTKEMFMADQE
ncbi:MAG: DNA translocase FtsK [Tuberibacillus sp.]